MPAPFIASIWEVSDMLIGKRANSFSNSFISNLLTFVTALALTGPLVLVGCDSNEAAEEPEPEIAGVVISPDSASIEVGEQVDFSVVARTASGDTVRDADVDIEWWSTDPDVFTVASGGTATGRNAGTAFCAVELSSDAANTAVHQAVKRPFVGRDSAFVMVF